MAGFSLRLAKPPSPASASRSTTPQASPKLSGRSGSAADYRKRSLSSGCARRRRCDAQRSSRAQLCLADEAHRPAICRQALEQEDRLVEMVERTVGVSPLAEQRDAGLRNVIRRVAAQVRKRWRTLRSLRRWGGLC